MERKKKGRMQIGYGSRRVSVGSVRNSGHQRPFPLAVPLGSWISGVSCAFPDPKLRCPPLAGPSGGADSPSRWGAGSGDHPQHILGVGPPCCHP